MKGYSPTDGFISTTFFVYIQIYIYIYINLGADHLSFRGKRAGHVFLANQIFVFTRSKNQNISFVEHNITKMLSLKTAGSMSD